MSPSTSNNTPMSGEADKMKPVAVVGMACRYPDEATSPSAFYDMLVNARSAWGEVPKNRYDIDSFYHPNRERIGTTTARGGHWMKEDPANFDAPFFQMTASEATAHDPQLRMLLEVTFECLDNAGKPMGSLVGSDTSVFVASSSGEYASLMLHDEENIPQYAAVGSGTTMLANRLSYFYDLRGPSIAIDTACSGGLVAAHLGCESVRNGDSKTSLVAASQLILSPSGNLGLQRLQFLSSDSRCFTFDDRANGYARGEGICVLMLKDMDQALLDGDTIRAVIRGSGTNQDGKTPGIVQPNSEAQAALMRQTYRKAGLDYLQTHYFEAHGTGTKLGDPLEMNALSKSLQTEYRDPNHPLYVGSVKTNIGHLEGGAGLAGLLKTILSLENGVILPNVNFEHANPKLRMNDWHVKVATKATPWPTRGLRRASVNSFGYGGSNCHCIVEDAENYLKERGLVGNTVTRTFGAEDLSDDEDSGRGSMSASSLELQRSPKLFVFSSPEQAALQRLATSHADHIEKALSKLATGTEDFLDNLAFTLSTRRSVFQWRSAMVADSVDQLVKTLREPVKGYRTSKTPGIVYCFTGQGAQWYAMGRELLQYDIFSRTVKAADVYLKSLGADWSVIEELGASEEQSKLHLAKYSQPLCAVLQVGLVNLLSDWGVRPTAVAGHSSGEIGEFVEILESLKNVMLINAKAAAYAAGYISAEQCWKIAYHRGRLSNDLNKIAPDLVGSMMAVGLSEEKVKPYLEKLDEFDNVVVACINSPSNVTLSGDAFSIAKLEQLLKADNIFARKLKVEVAYHSPHMKVLAEQYHESIKGIPLHQPASAPLMFSTVTGALIDGAELDASYWVRNMVSPVQFTKAFEAVFPSVPAATRRNRRGALSADTILEIGPHSAMQGPLRQILTKVGHLEKTDYLSMLSRGEDAVVTSLEAMGRLWTKGQPVKLLEMNRSDSSPEVLQPLTDLPNYPWNHSARYWHESSQTKNHRYRMTPRLDLLGGPVADWNPHEPRWKNSVRTSDTPWLTDHRIQDSLLYPAASMLCAVLEGGRLLADKSANVEGYELRDVVIGRALVVPTTERGIATALHMKKRRVGTKANEAFWYEFTLYSEPLDQEPVEHCSGLLQIQYKNQEELDPEVAASCQLLKEHHLRLQGRCTKAVKPERFYEDWTDLGIQWGPNFQGLTDIQHSDDAACVTVTTKDTRKAMPAEFEHEHLLHPTTLESCFQASFAPSMGSGKGRIPTSIDSLYVAAKIPKGAGAKFVGHSTLSQKGFNKFVTDIVMSDESWSQPNIIARGMTFTAFGGDDASSGTEKNPWEVRKLCSQVSYKEDLDHIRQGEADVIFQGDDHLIETWMQLSGHKRPSQRVLQLNSGDFPLTRSILERLGGKDGSTPWFSQYIVTSDDAAKLEQAKELLGAWDGGEVEFKVLKPAEEFAEQGFESNIFDAIVVANALGDSTSLDGATLNRCFDSLRPGGKLILGGISQGQSEWDKLLQSSKFSSVDILVKGAQCQSAMVVSGKPVDHQIPFNDIILVQPATVSKEAQALIKGLVEQLSLLGIDSEISDLEKATTADSDGNIPASMKRVISLLEIEAPFISHLSESDFHALKALLTKGRGGLWITRSGLQLDPSGDPEFATSAGLLRCLRCEHPDGPMSEFALSSKFLIGEPKAADLIIKGFKSMFQAESTDSKVETEIAELDGRIFIPRLYDHKPLNDHLDRIGKPALTELQPVIQSDRPLKLEIGTPGNLETLHFVDDERPLEPMADNEVEIEVLANGINLKDMMVSMGSITDTELGVDAAGIVKKVGSEVQGVKVGDRVATFCIGAYRNILRVQGSMVAKIPDNMTLEEGASLPCVYTTAYYALCKVGHLEAGETILIHSAAGGLGQAAIQLAKYIGAEIFVTAGSPSKRQLLMDEFDIPADHVFDSRELHFAKGMMRMTNDRGVDVVLNSMSGEGLRKTWECISMFGRFLEVGKKDIMGNTGLEMSPFLRNVTFAGINLEASCPFTSLPRIILTMPKHMIRNDQRKAASTFRSCFNLIREGKVGLMKPIHVYRWSEMETAFRTIQQGNHVGKMVFKMDPDDLVPVIPRALGTAKLDSNATYVIVGGLGGIGRSLVFWLAELGAKNIAIISRSGTAKPEAKATMDELADLGINAKSYLCDIIDVEAFSATVARISSENPPIKGAIHCAMHVNDYYLNITTYEQWKSTHGVKVQGALNMHNSLPKDLDFFVMLSSASGYIGTPKLASYASGNTFNDGLAQHRRSLGLKACAPGFGFIAGIGWARENVKISGAHKADYDLMAIHPPEVKSIIRSAISGYAVGAVPMPPQVATTMGTGGELQHTKLIKTRDWFNDPKFAYLARLDVRKDLAERQGGGGDVKTALEGAPSLAHAADVVEGALAAKLAHSMSMATEDIDSSKPVSAYGVDSLVSMEIRNWVSSVLKSNTGVFDILNSGPITQLAAKIAENSILVPEAVRQ